MRFLTVLPIEHLAVLPTKRPSCEIPLQMKVAVQFEPEKVSAIALRCVMYCRQANDVFPLLHFLLFPARVLKCKATSIQQL